MKDEDFTVTCVIEGRKDHTNMMWALDRPEVMDKLLLIVPRKLVVWRFQ